MALPVAGSPRTVLVVDDEATIREVIRRYLERDGFIVREAATAIAALDALAEALPDLIVLDLMLPGIDGLALTRQLRTPKPGGEHEAWQRIPIIMLTARGETSDRIRGLDLGADDYLAKPFSPQELVSRIRAVLRRAGEPALADGQELIFDGLRLDPVGRTAVVNGHSVTLTAKEFDLLWFFARHPRQVFTRTPTARQRVGPRILWRPVDCDGPHPPAARKDRGRSIPAALSGHGLGRRVPI